MSRTARIKAASGVYHVIFRGINRQQIFEETEDYKTFLRILQKCKEKFDFELYAYCIMSNHCHLLIRTREAPLGEICRSIGVRFALWYNRKYERTGHLFQDRYRSEPVETQEYFLTVLRYIHMNPVKAGICGDAASYPFCSCNDYFGNELIDSWLTKKMLSEEEFAAFHAGYDSSAEDEEFLEYEKKKKKMTDQEAGEILFQAAFCRNISEFQRKSVFERRLGFRRLKERGMTYTQISRITGYSVRTIKRYLL